MGQLLDVLALDATGQADLIRRKEVTPAELVETVIEQIERLNPVLNAVVIPMCDVARTEASRAWRDGPFAGVPFLLKDLVAEYAGAPYTAGSAFLRGYISPVDTELVRRYKRAGLIIVGKTSCPEFGVGPYTEPRLYGPVRNPWDLARTPGGSSGGSAAAVAAGIVPMAHGNDGGGSIRIPASCTGLFGLKPTRARNPLGPDYGDLWGGLIMEHALTRSVRDSAILLDATSGPEVGDPYWAPPPAGRFADAVHSRPERLRIAFTSRTPFGTHAHPECVAAARDAAALCEHLGHEVQEAAPDIDGDRLWEAFTKTVAAAAASYMEDLASKTGRAPTADLFEPLIWDLAARGRALSAAEFLLLRRDLQRMGRDFARFFQRYDVWLTPTVGQPPVPIGTFALGENGDAFELRRRVATTWTPFTYIQNVSGQPAMSVPLYWTSDGLPIGTNFTARFGDEATLFSLAAQLEEARPWAGRRPPVSVFSALGSP